METPLQKLDKWLNDRWSDPGKLIPCTHVSVQIEQMKDYERDFIRQLYDEAKYHAQNGTTEEYEMTGTQYYDENFKKK